MPPSPDPVVSVVIATHGRAAMLAETLDGLAAQTLGGVEVIVVDDDSPDETPDVVAARGFRHIRVPRGGPGRARQRGWQEAGAPVVAFTDDDCVPEPGWLAALLRPITEDRADLVQGRTLPRPDQLDRTGPWSRTQQVESESGFYQTCNMAYRRQVLEAVGGFHPGFPYPAGEDTDLAWRAKEAGYRSAFAADAVVHHAVWPSSYRAYLADRRRWGSVVLVLRLHPQLRFLAYRRWFFRPSHARTVALVAGLAATGAARRWLPPALAAGVGAAYLYRTRGAGRPAPERLVHLGEVLLADLVETGVFAAASLRYRTLLL